MNDVHVEHGNHVFLSLTLLSYLAVKGQALRDPRQHPGPPSSGTYPQAPSGASFATFPLLCPAVPAQRTLIPLGICSRRTREARQQRLYLHCHQCSPGPTVEEHTNMLRGSLHCLRNLLMRQNSSISLRMALRLSDHALLPALVSGPPQTLPCNSYTVSPNEVKPLALEGPFPTDSPPHSAHLWQAQSQLIYLLRRLRSLMSDHQRPLTSTDGVILGLRLQKWRVLRVWKTSSGTTSFNLPAIAVTAHHVSIVRSKLAVQIWHHSRRNVAAGLFASLFGEAYWSPTY